MGKISPVAAKYIVHAQIQIDGIVDRPDVIGAIFGQTEGLLGSELELRELQRSGRIGRIEVKSETRQGKTYGTIIIPSSLDKAETAIIGAALETIQRIGPCNSKVKIEQIEDVRISKRNFVLERAKELLKVLTGTVLPDSQELAEEVAYSVRMMEITEYGKDRLPAGPSIDESDDLIVVEGRADVLNLLKHGIKNCIGLNGVSIPQTILDLAKKKEITLFVDGDRGGDIIIRELSNLVDIDYVCKAPDGKEVEEITKKEIHKALRSKVALEQAQLELNGKSNDILHKPDLKPKIIQRPQLRNNVRHKKIDLSSQQKTAFKTMLGDLIGTRGAYILDENLNILGKVPTSELNTTLKSLKSVFAVVFDGIITKETSYTAERSDVKYLVGMNSNINPRETKVEVLVNGDLQ